MRREQAIPAEACGQGRACNCKSSMWADMAPEVLANIFSRLPFKQLLSVIPCVCKPWMHASNDPLCWQVLDLRELSFQPTNHRLPHLLLRRTEGHLREFVFPYMNHPGWLELLENSAPVLQKLHIPYSCASNEWAINMAPLMTVIKDLDLSNINGAQISHEALEALGQHCKLITHLRRNNDLCSQSMSNNSSKVNSAAFAIALNYPSLKHLELRRNLISTQGVRAILDGCPMLEHLDLTACVMDMDEVLLRECRTRLRVFLEPWHTDEANHDDDDDENDSDNGWCDYVWCDCHNKEFFYDFGDIEDEYGDEIKEDEDGDYEDVVEGEGEGEVEVEVEDEDEDHGEDQDEDEDGDGDEDEDEVENENEED